MGFPKFAPSILGAHPYFWKHPYRAKILWLGARRIRMVRDTEPTGSLSNMWRESQKRHAAFVVLLVMFLFLNFPGVDSSIFCWFLGMFFVSPSQDAMVWGLDFL